MTIHIRLPKQDQIDAANSATKRHYEFQIRGVMPIDLKKQVSALHAKAIKEGLLKAESCDNA